MTEHQDGETARRLADIFLAVARIALDQADERGDDAYSEGREVLRALVGEPVRKDTNPIKPA